MPEIVQQIGAIAGFAAILGLAVLSMVIFAQARDLRRLREWAGGAPERDAEMREVTEAVAAERSEELRIAAAREDRRQVRRYGDEGSFWERLEDRLGRGGRAVAVVAVVILLGAGIAYGATTLMGEDSSRTSTQPRARGGGGIKPSSVTVSVLNGTAVANVAGEYGESLESRGFNVDEVTNTTSSFTQSVVMFKEGRRPQAELVGRQVGISNVQPISQEVAAVSGDAGVTVVVGLDKADEAPGA